MCICVCLFQCSFFFVFVFHLEKLYTCWVIGGKSNYAYCIYVFVCVFVFVFCLFLCIPSGEVVHGPGNWRQPFSLGRQRQSRAIGNFCILPINFVPMSTNQPQTNRGPPSPIINQVLQNTNQMQILISATKYATKRKIAGTSKRNI